MEFVEFREYVILTSREDEEVLYEVEWTLGKAQICRWVIDILEEWAEYASGMTHKQQDQVLWRIGSNPMFVGWWLEEGSEIERADQLRLLDAAKGVTLSIPKLYGPGQPMDTAYFMWWDLLISDASNLEISDRCLEILGDLSWHADQRVQCAALHGLGHLSHPRRPAVVDEYIRRHPEAITDSWVQQCREGTVM